MMPSKIEQARQLMTQALALLDEAAELRAAPHLDMAIHELDRVLGKVPGENASASIETH